MIDMCSGIQREEEKVKRMMKDAAKKGDKDVCKMLAKEVITSRRAITRIYTSKAHLNSVQCQMKGQLGEHYYLLFHIFIAKSML